MTRSQHFLQNYKPLIHDGLTLEDFFKQKWLPPVTNSVIHINALEKLASALRHSAFKNEDDFTDWLGPWLQSSLCTTVTSKVLVKVTRKNGYMNGLKPDISSSLHLWLHTSALFSLAWK